MSAPETLNDSSSCIISRRKCHDANGMPGNDCFSTTERRVTNGNVNHMTRSRDDRGTTIMHVDRSSQPPAKPIDY